VILCTSLPAESQNPPDRPVTPNVGAKQEEVRSDANTERQNVQPLQPTPLSVTVTQPKSADELAYDRQQREQDRAIQQEIANTTRGLFWLAIVQSVLGGLGLLITMRAANAAKDSADVAKKTLWLTQRAEIAIATPGIINLAGDKAIGVKYEILNAGNSRADVTQTVARIRVAETLPDTPEYKRGHVTGGHHIAAGKGVVRTVFMTQSVDDPERDAIAAGRKFVYVWGRVDYADVFEHMHVVGFVLQYLKDRNEFSLCPELPQYTYALSFTSQ